MADQKISDLTPTTPADADNLPIERGAAANFKVSFSALRTWLDGFFAPASHPSDTNNPHSVTAAQAGADPAGTAAAAVAAHEAAGDPHSQYLTQAEADPLYDASGTAAAAVAAHEAAPDPHSQYLTQAEADPLYAPAGHVGAGGAEHPVFTPTVAGFTPASGGGTTNFLRADGQFAEPPGAGGGEDNDGVNIGAGAEVFETKVGLDLRFRTLVSGDASVTFTQNPTEIDIRATGAGGGESNTQTNQGAGVQFGLPKNGVDLPIRTLTSSGSTLDLSQLADTINADVNQGQLDHTAIQNVGTNTHAQIDTHIADATLHFTEGSIDHTAIQNVGTNTHAQIDTHIANGDIHRTQAADDARYGQLGAVNDWSFAQRFGSLGIIVQPDATTTAYMYAPDGVYDPLDGGLVLREGVAEVHGSLMLATSMKHAFGQGAQVYVTEEGEFYPVEAPPAAWSISATDVTDTVLGSGSGTGSWVQLSYAPALALPEDVGPSDRILIDLRIYWHNLAGNASGIVDIGFGIDGAQPTEVGASKTLGEDFEGPIPVSWSRTGLTLTSGQVLAVWARRQSGSNANFNPVAEGVTQTHTATISRPTEGGAGGGDVTGPASATDDNFAAFDGISGKLIKDAGVSASDFAAAGSPYALEVPHTWTVASGTVDNALDVLEWVVPAPAGQTTTIKRLSYKVKTGGVSLTLQQNGSPIAGYTGLAVSTVRGTTSGDVVLSDLDELDIVIDSGSGTGLSVTVLIEYAGTL